ncbi:asparagine synthase-related protein [Moorena sp. SIO4G3]|uniref:asparagine synthase-related protein n=1 Tax=Moorena sp. SIO4G3 TaxID=2607821 RepID=UPI00142BD1D0|nr:asparagine synthase-related protein [Moorena sp. SIO4G3]NEO77981.1 asparagine synthase [Moorena sp. SIO4G3]
MRVGFDVFTGLDTGLDGDVEFRVFPSKRDHVMRSPLVTFARNYQSRTAAVLMGHLCYQDELLAKLPQSITQNCTSDAAIALAVYSHFGRQGLEQLEGEFSLVVWDGELQRLFALRDPLGCWQLFWLKAGTTLALSTSILPLLDLLPNKPFNLDFLAQFLMLPSPAVELPTEETAFTGINRVLPGTILTITATGKVESYRWWDWAAKQHHNNSLTLESAGEHYAHLLRQAVKQRMERGQIAAHLSGGMDSSSVVCLARDWMLSGVGKPQLDTLTAVYKRPSLAGERAYAEMVLEQGGPIVPHFLDADDALVFRWFNDDIPYHDEPYAGLSHLAMEKLLVEAAHKLGADTILTGMGADELLVGTYLSMASQLRQGQWLAAFSEAQRMAQGNNQSIWSILYQFCIGPALPMLMLGTIGTWWRGGFGRWPKVGKFAIPPWILPEFAQGTKMQTIGRQNAQRLYGGSAELSVDLWSLQASVGDWSQWYLAAPQGMHNSHPFLDSRVLSFCLELPTALREIPGMPKPVLQTAMRGILPEPIRTRRDKATFNDIYWLGLSKHLPCLEFMVRNSPSQELGIFDAQQLIHAMRQAAVGIGNMEAIYHINTTLALIAWFDKMMAAQHQSLEAPTEVHQLHRQVEKITC